MPSVADCLRQHAPAYLAKYGDDVPSGHRKVLGAITRCRTGELGGVLYHCDRCGHEHWVGRSCGNRHCSTCQLNKTADWLERQTKRLLPVHHFLVGFTVPSELRMIVRANQAACYRALFDSGSGTIRGLLANPRWLGSSRVGYFGVLHTWGRDPTVYNPHVHFVVPGGGVSADRSRWLSTPTNMLFPEAVASPIFRAKFRDAFAAAGLIDKVDPGVWDKWWEVDVKAVGDGQAVLKYLAPYIYRVAISDKRIESCDESSVTFSYTPSGTKQSKTRHVSGEEFVGGFVQHVLPRGLQKVRHYGWMSSGSKQSLDEVRWLVWLYLGWTYWLASGHAPQAEPMEQPQVRCARCGDAMRIVAVLHADCTLLVEQSGLTEHSVKYLDSG